MVDFNSFVEGATGCLGAGTWTKHGVTPDIWEYNMSYFMKNKEGIMVKKLESNCVTLANGQVLFERQRGEIIGWSKNTPITRNNLYDDLVLILETCGGYNILNVKRHDQPREHNFRVEVERLEER